MPDPSMKDLAAAARRVWENVRSTACAQLRCFDIEGISGIRGTRAVAHVQFV